MMALLLRVKFPKSCSACVCLAVHADWPSGITTITQFQHILHVSQTTQKLVVPGQSNQTLTCRLCTSDISSSSQPGLLVTVLTPGHPTHDWSTWPFCHFPHRVTQDHHVALWHLQIRLWLLWLLLLMSGFNFYPKTTIQKLFLRCILYCQQFV